MAITLSDVQMNTGDKLTASVIDQFRRSSVLLDRMPFDDTVLPATGGAALSYGYYRITSTPDAAFRAVGDEYTASEAKKEKMSVDLKVFGGAFSIDRVLASAGGFIDEVDIQARQMIAAARTLFHDTLINGDTASGTNAFDGLGKALTGTSTEYNAEAASPIDLSAAELDANYGAFLDMLDEFLLSLDGTPSALLLNSALLAKIRACVRRTGIAMEPVEVFGREVPAYDGIPLIDLGEKAAGTPIVGTSGGVTSLFAVRLGLDGLHGVSMSGQSPIKVWLPDFSTAGAVKKGEVEMVAAMALKSTRAAGVFRKIKIA